MNAVRYSHSGLRVRCASMTGVKVHITDLKMHVTSVKVHVTGGKVHVTGGEGRTSQVLP